MSQPHVRKYRLGGIIPLPTRAMELEPTRRYDVYMLQATLHSIIADLNDIRESNFELKSEIFTTTPKFEHIKNKFEHIKTNLNTQPTPEDMYVYEVRDGKVIDKFYNKDIDQSKLIWEVR